MAKTGTPWWDPSLFEGRRPRLVTRARITRAVREVFAAQDFVEVETSALQVSPGLEPHLKAFATTLDEPLGQGSRALYLHTSPEFAMKKLLVAGMPRFYQLAHVFRNGERSDLHHPEFTMLEWYRAGASYTDLMADCEGVVRAAARAVPADSLRYRQSVCDPFAPFERLSVAEAFERHADIDLLACLGDAGDLDPDPRPLAEAARSRGIHTEKADRFDDVFFRVLLTRIEPRLGLGRPTILYDYPVCMAALARAKPEDPKLAERFELYLCGVEVANGSSELTVAAEQRRRFLHDSDLKERLYGVRYPIDEDFLAALEQGLPPSAGIALGFDRLLVLAMGAERVADVLWAPVAGMQGDRT
jgi:lysyl-tRNA synthetase class 2